MKTKLSFKGVRAISFIFLLYLIQSCIREQPGSGGQLYDLGTGLESRSISFENPTGEPGKGGQTASKLGAGRKGFPSKGIAPGETVVLCDIAGPGTIRHIWMTGGFKDKTRALRSMVVRAYWDGQETLNNNCLSHGNTPVMRGRSRSA